MSSHGPADRAGTIAVLLVEDNPSDARLCSALLENAGGREPFAVTVAATLAEALALLPGRFELVLLDLHLPDGRGLDALHRVLESVATVPVVVFTGLEDEHCARACLEAGAQDYLNKNDMDPRVLRRAVDFARARARAGELTRRLEHADRLVAIGQIAAGVAHEVRSPVTFVQTNTFEVVRRVEQLRDLVDGDDDLRRRSSSILDDLARLLADNVEGIGRVARLMSDFGSFSSPDRPGKETPRPIDAVELCRASLGLVAPQVRHRALLVSELAPVPPVLGDPRRLGQVIVNLVLNAAQSIAPDDRRHDEVRVETLHEADMVCIAVTDTGCGITSDALSRVFEPFYSTKAGAEGTGLGLTISLEIVKGMGGFIDVHSTLGAGTRFEVWLPAVQSKREVEALTRPPAKLEIVRERRRVLLVDDEVLLLRALGRVLRRHHDVVEACGGEAALDLLRSGERFDVILCDLMMAGIDGVELHAAIGKEFPELLPRFVVLTGGAVTPRTTEFIERGLVPIVAKPVALDTLLRAVDERVSTK